MRDYRDAKAMARSLRDALSAKALPTTYSESLELFHWKRSLKGIPNEREQ